MSHDPFNRPTSVCASGGQSLVLIGKLLGHSLPATTARYAHLAADPLRQATGVVGERIAAAMSGASAAEIVRLPKKGPRRA